jgi:hypothetical protein
VAEATALQVYLIRAIDQQIAALIVCRLSRTWDIQVLDSTEFLDVPLNMPVC